MKNDNSREDFLVGSSLGQAVGVPMVNASKARYMIAVLDSLNIDGRAKYLELAAKRPKEWPPAPTLEEVMSLPDPSKPQKAQDE